MAKFVITVDTEEKTVDVSLNGNQVTDVKEVSICSDGNGEYCSVRINSYDEPMAKVRRITTLYAAEQELASDIHSFFS